MKTRLRNAIVVLAIAAQAACGDSNGPKELQLRDIAGSWKATKFEITNLESSEKVDLLSSGDIAEFSMTLSATGAVTFSSRLPEETEPDVTTGTLVLDGTKVTITLDSDVMTGTVALANKELTIDIPELEDGIKLVMVFRRM